MKIKDLLKKQKPKKVAIKRSCLTEHNKEIKSYLKTYLTSKDVNFSILLTGPWGSGKTYFIRELIEEVKSKTKVLYVSLNGVASITELENAILAAFVPGKIAKAGRFALAVGKSLNFSYAGVELDPSSVVNAVATWFSTSTRRAIVFDDIERCGLSVKKWSGYLATLLEGLRVPIIFIGNEAKLLDSNEYSKIKEKFIGQTFQLETNVDQIAPALFLDVEWALPNESEFREECCKIFNAVKEETGNANYRAFKGALWQLKYWSNQLEKTFDKKESLRLHFSFIFFVTAYYIQLGLLTLENWESVKVKAEKSDGTVKEQTSISFDDILSVCRQQRSDFFDYEFWAYPLLSSQTWRRLALEGNITVNQISSELRQTKYFYEPRVWEPLCYYWNLETKEIEARWTNIEKLIKEHVFTEQQEIRMVFGLKEALARYKYDTTKRGDWESTQAAILVEYKKYIDWCYSNDKISEVLEASPFDTCYGYAIIGANNKKSLYREMRDYQWNKRTEKIKGREIIPLLKEDFSALVELFSDSRKQDTVLFYNEPRIVAHFLNLVMCAKNCEIYSLVMSLQERYRVRISNWQDFLGRLSPEYETWKIISKQLSDRIEKKRESTPDDYARIASLTVLLNFINEKIISRLATVMKTNP